MAGIQDITASDASLYGVEDHFYERGLKKIEDRYSWYVFHLAPAISCDRFDHFMVPPATWKANGEDSVKDGEYQYWVSCPWREPEIWNSVRDLIVDHVEYIENIIKTGGTEGGRQRFR